MDKLFFKEEHEMLRNMVRDFAVNEVEPISRKMDETDLSEEAANPALETESIETEKQEQQTKPVENKKPELETEAAKTEDSVPETETDESAELDAPK